MDEHRHMSLYCHPWVMGCPTGARDNPVRATIAWSGNRGTLKEGNERGPL